MKKKKKNHVYGSIDIQGVVCKLNAGSTSNSQAGLHPRTGDKLRCAASSFLRSKRTILHSECTALQLAWCISSSNECAGVAPLGLAHTHICRERRLAAHAASSVNSTTDACAVAPAMSGQDIRKAFLEFYSSRGHQVLPSSSLVPEDPTVLLTIAGTSFTTRSAQQFSCFSLQFQAPTAVPYSQLVAHVSSLRIPQVLLCVLGMLQFKPIFLGQRPREVPRATTTQKCIRTNDIENVGVTARHHTFFEMLGNFSFGDYFKEDACKWAWQLVTEVYKLPKERVFVSVYEEDDEAFALWRDTVGTNQRQLVLKHMFWLPKGVSRECLLETECVHKHVGNYE